MPMKVMLRLCSHYENEKIAGIATPPMSIVEDKGSVGSGKITEAMKCLLHKHENNV